MLQFQTDGHPDCHVHSCGNGERGQAVKGEIRGVAALSKHLQELGTLCVCVLGCVCLSADHWEYPQTDSKFQGPHLHYSEYLYPCTFLPAASLGANSGSLGVPPARSPGNEDLAVFHAPTPNILPEIPSSKKTVGY